MHQKNKVSINTWRKLTLIKRITQIKHLIFFKPDPFVAQIATPIQYIWDFAENTQNE